MHLDAPADDGFLLRDTEHHAVRVAGKKQGILLHTGLVLGPVATVDKTVVQIFASYRNKVRTSLQHPLVGGDHFPRPYRHALGRDLRFRTARSHTAAGEVSRHGRYRLRLLQR